MHHGIYSIDTGFQRQGFDAAYLIVEKGHGALIDCATNHSRERIINTIHNAGLAPQDIDWLILTHVHLDHAGGAGALMQVLPNAKLAVHPRGVKHMIDPSRLWNSATQVYGEEEMERSYGKVIPVDATRVIEAGEGFKINLAGRILTCLETPGHARHHNAIHDTQADVIFSGDTFGLSYREFDNDQGAYIFPTTSPVEFSPEDLHASVERLASMEPSAIYLTHFNAITDIRKLGDDLHETIDAMVKIAHQHKHSPERHQALHQALFELYKGQIRAHGWHEMSDQDILAIIGTDVELNAQGLGVWLDRLAKHENKKSQ